MITPYSATNSSQLIADTKRERFGLTIYNNVTGSAYVAFSQTGVSTGQYSFILGASGYYEMPPDYYDGKVYAIYTNNYSGSLLVTELTK